MTQSRFTFTAFFLSIFFIQAVMAQPPEQKNALVEVSKVEKRLLGTVVTLNGTVQARYETVIGAEVSGKVEKILVDEGDRVKGEELLALIDPDRYEALFKAAKARLDKASQDLTRGRSLYEEGFLSREELDRRQVNYDTASATWEIARIEHKDDKITAPFSGIVTQRFVDPGEWLDRGDPVFEISDISVVHVKAPLPERLVQNVTVGQEAILTVSSFPDREFRGVVRAVIPKADEGKNYPAKIELENPDGALKNGMFARVQLILQSPEEVLMISKDAIVRRENSDLLFVIQDGTAREVRVQTGREEGALIEVKGDLHDGDRVAVTGNENLRDGDAVKIVNLP
jgi:membrane fusion protein (multidrug efflux system)